MRKKMESDEIEAASKAGTNNRNDKGAVIDYDEDRVRRLELIGCIQCWDCLLIGIFTCVCLYLYI